MKALKKRIKNEFKKRVIRFKNWLRYKLRNWLYPVGDNIMWRSNIYDLYPMKMVIDIDEKYDIPNYIDEMKYKASRSFGMEMYNKNLLNIEKENFDVTGQRPPWVVRYRISILIAVMREESKPKVMNPHDVAPCKAPNPNQIPFFGNPNIMS